MTRRLLFRSKSCGVTSTSGTCSELNSSLYLYDYERDENEEEEEINPVRTPLITTSHHVKSNDNSNDNHGNQFQIVDMVVAVLRKSLVTCTSVEEMPYDHKDSDNDNVDIGWPTDVQHVSHVTFDRFNGFLGLPLDLQPQLPAKLVPSASISVFGVSAYSMQCSYDEKGNSVPTILLMMQQQLYLEGGLQAEGIFRINAENSQEEYVRSQLNKGIVPQGIDVHSLAGLIKAWFRELPTGVLDSLSPEQVMHCNSEEDCTQLVKLLPPTEAALLDWAINLMADVVQHESNNKMNARNIAMVFAPNMTKMADPLTALIHAVQVMNLLKTLIVKTVGGRVAWPSCTDSHQGNKTNTTNTNFQSSKMLRTFSCQQTLDSHPKEGAKITNLFRSSTSNILESDGMENAWGFPSKHELEMDFNDSISTKKTKDGRVNPGNEVRHEYSDGERGGGEAAEGILDRLNLKKGVRKIGRHPVFQLSRTARKSGGVAIV